MEYLNEQLVSKAPLPKRSSSLEIATSKWSRYTIDDDDDDTIRGLMRVG
jgi:hypothetical protein